MDHSNDPCTPSMETTSFMERLPGELLSSIIDPLTLSLINKKMKQINDTGIKQILKNKCRVILSDENIFFNKLNSKEIYSLAKILIGFFSKKYVLFPTKQIFSLQKLKEALLNPTKKLFLSNDKNFLVENTSNDICVLYINPIDDNHLDFQLKFIFYFCDIMKRKGDIILHFKFSINDDDNKFFSASVKTIIRGIKLNLPLITISFYNVRLGDFFQNAFARALNQNTTLLELNIVLCFRLRYNPFKSLARVLKKNITLTKLNLSKNDIYDETESIAYALKDNTTLLELDLSFNRIGYKGIKRLATKGLTKNTTLKILNLNNNLIGSYFTGGDGRFNGVDHRISGASCISDLFYRNRTLTTLTTLSLDYNNICSGGACEIAYALKNNTTLLTLSLVHNTIGFNGAMALVEALKENNTLEIINLSDNYFNNITLERGKIQLNLQKFAFNCCFIY